jgi:hypothetical protein
LPVAHERRCSPTPGAFGPLKALRAVDQRVLGQDGYDRMTGPGKAQRRSNRTVMKATG